MVGLQQKECDRPMLVLTGPTAIGKTELSLQCAERFGCEIISVDSMQVYRHMNIGTAKPSVTELNRVPHHLIDVADPDEQYDAARFAADATDAIEKITANSRIPLLTGGTGLYLKTLTDGIFDAVPADLAVRERLAKRLEEEGRDVLYEELTHVDPGTATRIHPNDSQRLLRGLEIYYTTGTPWSVHLQQQARNRSRDTGQTLTICLTCDRQKLYDRIAKRTGVMLTQGFVEEVEQLRNMGYGPGLQSMQSIGYKHINNYLDGTWSREEAVALLVRDTRRYAKRQMTWFRKMPDCHFVNHRDVESIVVLIENFLKNYE